MKIGFACGVFDLFHAGHVLMLKECKEHCDYLVVGLNSAESIDSSINPGKLRPVFNVVNRKLILESCVFIDEVIVYNNELELKNMLESGRFHVRFLGDDYKNKTITAPKAIGEIYYTDRSHNLSTSNYRRLIEKKLSEE